MRTGFVFGLFDLFHVGDLDLLRQAAQRCDRLIAGAYADELAARLWSTPYVPLAERLDILVNIRYVAGAIALSSLDIAAAARKVDADVVFVGPGRPGEPTAAELRAVAQDTEIVTLVPKIATGSSVLRRVLEPTRTAVA
ncbi:adenylyltransferase/cytidyltransferase family protein [Fodinicola acaciae]|uniref:adenylyltransferase/cytidyltransferase family protein n=1 Tax=Fodinicola acaciae TaxID=2681555 RepID=UPI0013D228A9|nr:adenylyltransferase/cytidyltransferase family protein [Fodinicola acaciae]